MSDFAIRTAPESSLSLRSVYAWFRQARIAASLSDQGPAHRDAPFLADVGLNADEIGQAVDRGSAEIGLLGLGWQQPGRGGRW